ncbi:MAG: hypothetical protein D6740_01655 [Alphaproteobacteria bacterium]|nr:MAG: hypothetical protein D6740_01655 [Alphaproteobacteria bacterium]
MIHRRLTTSSGTGGGPIAAVGVLVLLAGLFLTWPVTAQVMSALKSHDSAQPIEAKARTQVLLEDEKVAVLEGDAEIRQGDLTLRADRIAIRYEAGAKADRPTVTRMEAKGHVRLTSPSETVAADWGIYDVTNRMILMGGRVRLQREGNLLEGSRMEIDLDSGLIRLSAEGAGDGRVKGIFRPATKDKEATSPGRPAGQDEPREKEGSGG